MQQRLLLHREKCATGFYCFESPHRENEAEEKIKINPKEMR
jgi:hypothetical protein